MSLTGNFSASGTVEANAVTLKTLSFKNASNYVAATFGISSGNTLTLTNSNGNIVVTGQSYVDIGPAIKENGTLLEDKYVLKSSLPDWVYGSAPTGGMTQAQCDARYARLSNGLSQFIISGVNTATSLCSQIGAMNQTTADGRYARLSNWLSDMAVTDEDKEKIRENIGAVGVNDIPSSVINDTGWIDFNGGTMHARQWGRMVGVYGTVSPGADGSQVFQLPIEVDAPTYDVIVTLCYTGSNAYRQNVVVIKIAGGTKIAQVLNRFVSESVITNNLVVSFNYIV